MCNHLEHCLVPLRITVGRTRNDPELRVVECFRGVNIHRKGDCADTTTPSQLGYRESSVLQLTLEEFVLFMPVDDVLDADTGSAAKGFVRCRDEVEGELFVT
jgi:hypothetical protein